MVSTPTPAGELDQPAPDFALPGVDGKLWTLRDCAGPNGVLVMFICNHCPYVKAIRERLVQDCRELHDHGIGSVAIMANDPTDYPEDSFDNMRRIADQFGFPFPYLYDETQTVARAYGAVCTPDFFGYDKALKLQYRGRLDAGGRGPLPAAARRELLEAMIQIAATGRGPAEQTPSIGCSIKWRTA